MLQEQQDATEFLEESDTYVEELGAPVPGEGVGKSTRADPDDGGHDEKSREADWMRIEGFNTCSWPMNIESI
ncbi:hypothetical protein ACP4OV_025567 [Aristida adscensionis]